MVRKTNDKNALYNEIPTEKAAKGGQLSGLVRFGLIPKKGSEGYKTLVASGGLRAAIASAEASRAGSATSSNPASPALKPQSTNPKSLKKASESMPKATKSATRKSKNTIVVPPTLQELVLPASKPITGFEFQSRSSSCPSSEDPVFPRAHQTSNRVQRQRETVYRRADQLSQR